MVDVLNGRCMVQLIQRAAKGQLEVVGNLGQTQTLNRGGSGLLHGRAISSRGQLLGAETLRWGSSSGRNPNQSRGPSAVVIKILNWGSNIPLGGTRALQEHW